MKMTIIALALLTSLPALAQESTNESMQHSTTSGAKGSISMDYANWILRTAGHHGSSRIKNCVRVTASFWGAKTEDPWSLPDSSIYREPSVCMHVLGQIAKNGIQLKAVLFPDPVSKESGSLYAKAAKGEASLFSLANNEIGEIEVDFANKSQSWRSNTYQFDVKGGVISMSRYGRIVFDGSHVDGKSIKVSVDVGNSQSAGSSGSTTASPTQRMKPADDGI
ncbi:MAG: hypothetical protein ABIK25_07195 [Pseudomonadota bacterium]